MGIFIHTKIKLVEKGSGAPAKDVSVKLYDQDPLSDDLLGEGTPDTEGNVTIKFDLDKIKSADTPLEQFPDLYFKVFKGTTLVFESPLADDLDTKQEGDFSFKEGKVIDLGTFLV